MSRFRRWAALATAVVVLVVLQPGSAQASEQQLSRDEVQTLFISEAQALAARVGDGALVLQGPPLDNPTFPVTRYNILAGTFYLQGNGNLQSPSETCVVDRKGKKRACVFDTYPGTRKPVKEHCIARKWTNPIVDYAEWNYGAFYPIEASGNEPEGYRRYLEVARTETTTTVRLTLVNPRTSDSVGYVEVRERVFFKDGFRDSMRLTDGNGFEVYQEATATPVKPKTLRLPKLPKKPPVPCP